MKLKKDKLINLILMFFLISSLLALFLIGTFLDLQIAKTIINKNSLFGKTFDYFGQIVFFIPLNFLLYSTIVHFSLYKKISLIFKTFYVFIITISPIIFLSQALWSKYDQSVMISIFITSCIYLIFAMLTFVYLNNKPEWLINDPKIFTKIILAIILMIIFALSTEVLKNIFSRPRPKRVLNNYYEYQPWWDISYIHGVGKNKSFPSGHVTSTITLITPIILFKWKSKETIFTILFTSIFVILVAISRMILGAHFLTDVTGAVIFSLSWLTVALFIKKNYLGVSYG